MTIICIKVLKFITRTIHKITTLNWPKQKQVKALRQFIHKRPTYELGPAILGEN